MVELRAYIDHNGVRRFERWFEELDSTISAKVAIALTRMSQGNFSNAKSVGSGVHEYRIDFGPGYRIYFGREGAQMIILIGGGTKKRQQNDIATAQQCWADYKERKKAQTL